MCFPWQEAFFYFLGFLCIYLILEIKNTKAAKQPSDSVGGILCFFTQTPTQTKRADTEEVGSGSQLSGEKTHTFTGKSVVYCFVLFFFLLKHNRLICFSSLLLFCNSDFCDSTSSSCSNQQNTDLKNKTKHEPQNINHRHLQSKHTSFPPERRQTRSGCRWFEDIYAV